MRGSNCRRRASTRSGVHLKMRFFVCNRKHAHLPGSLFIVYKMLYYVCPSYIFHFEKRRIKIQCLSRMVSVENQNINGARARITQCNVTRRRGTAMDLKGWENLLKGKENWRERRMMTFARPRDEGSRYRAEQAGFACQSENRMGASWIILVLFRIKALRRYRLACCMWRPVCKEKGIKGMASRKLPE